MLCLGLGCHRQLISQQVYIATSPSETRSIIAHSKLVTSQIVQAEIVCCGAAANNSLQ